MGSMSYIALLSSRCLGIRSFKRQLTKEEKLANGFSFEESIQELNEEEDEENVIRLQDDLESTKQVWSLYIGFFTSQKTQGLRWNILAVFVVYLKCLIWSIKSRLFFTDFR